MIEDFNDISKKYDVTKNLTSNILSKYEKVKILGLRAEQLQRGAQAYIDVDELIKSGVQYSPLNIAKKELNVKRLPYMICRKLPNGDKEYWKLEDMIII
jgi:DNA-directed RNA polymerase subunit K/omega